MKISGSHTEQIDSPSINILRLKEHAVITAITQKLSSEGKHVINIIHGAPSQLLGSVYKSITFLWEADDEDPVYQAFIEAEKQAKKEIAIQQKEEKVKKEQREYAMREVVKKEEAISNLKIRIENVERGKAKFNCLGIIIFNFIMSFGFIIGGISVFCVFEDVPIFLFCIAVGVIVFFISIKHIKVGITEKSEQSARIEHDQKHLSALKEELKRKEKEIATFKCRHNLN